MIIWENNISGFSQKAYEFPSQGFDHIDDIRHKFPPVEEGSDPIKRVVSYILKQCCHQCTSGHFLPGSLLLEHAGFHTR